MTDRRKDGTAERLGKLLPVTQTRTLDEIRGATDSRSCCCRLRAPGPDFSASIQARQRNRRATPAPFRSQGKRKLSFPTLRTRAESDTATIPRHLPGREISGSDQPPTYPTWRCNRQRMATRARHRGRGRGGISGPIVGFSEAVGDVPLSTGEKASAIAGGTLVFGGLGALVGSAFERWGRPD